MGEKTAPLQAASIGSARRRRPPRRGMTDHRPNIANSIGRAGRLGKSDGQRAPSRGSRPNQRRTPLPQAATHLTRTTQRSVGAQRRSAMLDGHARKRPKATRLSGKERPDRPKESII